MGLRRTQSSEARPWPRYSAASASQSNIVGVAEYRDHERAARATFLPLILGLLSSGAMLGVGEFLFFHQDADELGQRGDFLILHADNREEFEHHQKEKDADADERESIVLNLQPVGHPT